MVLLGGGRFLMSEVHLYCLAPRQLANNVLGPGCGCGVRGVPRHRRPPSALQGVRAPTKRFYFETRVFLDSIPGLGCQILFRDLGLFRDKGVLFRD